MKVFIVYWHPEPKSFNAALCRAAIDALQNVGHSVEVSDLHAMQFNPVSGRHNFKTLARADYFKQQLEEVHATDNHGFASDIEAEIQKIESCDLMIWQFPLWWFSVPAAIKGWVDRVFAMKRVYGGGRRYYEEGAFKGKRALISMTTGGTKDMFEPEGLNGDMEGILKPIHRGIFVFTGFDVLAPHIVYSPARLSPEDRIKAIVDYQTRLLTIDKENPIPVGTY